MKTKHPKRPGYAFLLPCIYAPLSFEDAVLTGNIKLAIKMADKIIKSGEDAVIKVISERDAKGNTLLQRIAMLSDAASEELIKKLLNALPQEKFNEALLLAGNSGLTIMHAVILSGKEELACYLWNKLSIEQRTNFRTITTSTGATLLHSLLGVKGISKFLDVYLEGVTSADKLELLKLTDTRGRNTPLHFAMSIDNPDNIRKLLVDLDKKDIYPLLMAANNNKGGNDTGDTPIHNAARNDNTANISAAFSFIPTDRRMSVMEKRGSFGDLSVHSAASSNHRRTVDTLIENMPDKDVVFLLTTKNKDGKTVIDMSEGDLKKNLKEKLEASKSRIDRPAFFIEETEHDRSDSIGTGNEVSLI